MLLLIATFLFFSNAQNSSLSAKEMGLLSEAVAKSLVSCEKIRGATLKGDFEFRNNTNETLSSDTFTAKIKSELRKNMGTRFSPNKKKKSVASIATLNLEKFEEGVSTNITYKLKLSFLQNDELLCEAENELTKTFTK
ncbi:hypothetical protein K2X05_07140 [bacterium]|nr:hypothetical protein [bacterium]